MLEIFAIAFVSYNELYRGLAPNCFLPTVSLLLQVSQPSAPQSFSGCPQAHIIAPFNDVLKRVVLAILNSNGLEPITWQQIVCVMQLAALFLTAKLHLSPDLHSGDIDGDSIQYDEKSLYHQSKRLRHITRIYCSHQESKDIDFIAAITPSPSSLARYHSAASPEARAALLAVPKTQQMTFPKQAYRLFLRRRCACKPKPELDALSLMTPWLFVSAIWQKRPARMPSSRTRTSKVGQPREEKSPKCLSTARQPLKVVRSFSLSSSRHMASGANTSKTSLHQR